MEHTPEASSDPVSLDELLHALDLTTIGDSYVKAKDQLEGQLIQPRRRTARRYAAIALALMVTVVAIPWPASSGGVKLAGALVLITVAAIRLRPWLRPPIVWGARSLSRPRKGAPGLVSPDPLAAAVIKANRELDVPLEFTILEYWLISKRYIVGRIVGVVYHDAVHIIAQHLLDKPWQPYDCAELGTVDPLDHTTG